MRLFSLRSIAISVAALSILPALLSAQQPTLRDRTGGNSAPEVPQAPAADDKPSLHDKDKSKATAPREIVLAVTVRDKKGNLVTNLTATDFTLTQDGRPQTIKSLAQQTDVPQLVGLAVDTSRAVEGATGSGSPSRRRRFARHDGDASHRFVRRRGAAFVSVGADDQPDIVRLAGLSS